MQYPDRRTCACLGCAGALLFYLSWGIAIILDGSWTFGTNTLSDLGISDNPGSVFMFNMVSCICCAGLWLVEVIGIICTERGMGRMYGILAFCSMITLICIGVFNKGFGELHLVFAWSYLFFVVVSMIVACFAGFFRRKLSITVTILMILSCPAAYAILPFPGFEATASILATLWSMIIAWAYGTYVPEA